MDSISGLKLAPIVGQIGYKSFPSSDSFYFAAKRALDIAVSVVALTLSAPILAAAAVLIKLDSPGPVFFKQIRVGAKHYQFGRKHCWQQQQFYCYKLRTMVNNAKTDQHQAYLKALITKDESKIREIEGEDAKVHKMVNDSRITRVGKYLRKLSLDEIPQFINVLRGEMSVVGPRPAIPYEVECYTPHHMRRLSAKPGITGLQQTTARCTKSFDEQVNLDLKYIESQSIWQDLKIIFKTPLAVFIERGA